MSIKVIIAIMAVIAMTSIASANIPIAVSRELAANFSVEMPGSSATFTETSFDIRMTVPITVDQASKDYADMSDKMGVLVRNIADAIASRTLTTNTANYLQLNNPSISVTVIDVNGAIYAQYTATDIFHMTQDQVQNDALANTVFFNADGTIAHRGA